MTKRALILPGWYQKPTDNWYPWLKKELEKKYFIPIISELPTIHTDTPDMEKMIVSLLLDVGVDHDTIVIGHSLGSLLALRLGERMTYRAMYLIAGWDFNDLTFEHRLFWKTPVDHEKIGRNVKQIYCITSDNDPYVTAFHAEQMSKRLHGTYILIKHAGHFTSQFGITQIPELLSYI